MSGKELNLLILEDDPDDAELEVKELERKGFIIKWMRVETESAFGKALEDKPDLILADYSLPSFDGMAALRIQQEIAPGIPLIIISGTIGEEIAVEFMKSGATDYIMKDKLYRLGPVVKRALEEAELRRERKKAERIRERLNEELAQKNKEMEQLLNITSHDLRTPLVNIQGFSKELKRSFDDLLSALEDENVPEEAREKTLSVICNDMAESLGYILGSTSKMDGLLSGLLQVSRLGRVKLRMEPLNMNELMLEITGMFKYELREGGVKFEIGELPSCYGDRVQLGQVFSNLIDNAIKYLDPKRPGVISISGENRDGKAVYCIEDNGIGIDPGYKERIFDLFYQLRPKGTKGDGLGLTIVQEIVGKHNGKVWVESEPGKGSRFFVSLKLPEKVNRKIHRRKSA